MNKIFIIFSFLIIQLFISLGSVAQITSPNADGSSTAFGNECYIFCASDETAKLGSLVADTPFDANSIFVWEKYDSIANVFLPFGSLNPNDTLQSSIYNLDDGCYKVTIESEGNSTSKQVWVLNNWIKVTHTEIPDSSSNCVEFKVWSEYEAASLTVYDTETGESKSLREPFEEKDFEWTHEDTKVYGQNPMISEPIASNKPVRYNLVIKDKFECTGEGYVDYDSKVTEAEFDADPLDGEAVLEVTFSNSSINYDSAYWFFFKDDFQIGLETADANDEPVDSVDFVLREDAPIYSYEYSGEYRVKLVTVKQNLTTGNCYDTTYIETNIDVIVSLVDVPNVFTPNGDGLNDVFVVESKSLKSMKVKIYNRWGGLVHSWKYSNITSNDYTIEHSVWDGRIGNRMASTGVYYYVIQYEGRDVYMDNIEGERDRIGKTVKETLTGFVHLFRGED